MQQGIQRWIPVLGGVLALQVAAAVALEWRGDGLAHVAPDTPLIAADLSTVDRLVLTGAHGPDDKAAPQSVQLVKRDGRWLLPGLYDAPADASKVEDLLKQLKQLKRGLAVATSSGSLDRFKVADQHFERKLELDRNGKPVDTLYLGESTGLHDSNGRTGHDSAVYSVALQAYDLPATPDAWFDPHLLARNAKDLRRIEVTQPGKPTVTLVQAQTAGADGAMHWAAQGLPAGEKLATAQADTLAQAVADLKVDKLLGTAPQPQWQPEKPQLTLALTDTHGKTVQWVLTQPAKGEGYILKASDEPWYAQVQSWNARPLMDAAAPDKLVVADGGKAPAAATAPAARATVAQASARHAGQRKH